ncbi:MAG TPA: quinohemoprotein amine dehydrogenase subunit gamma [Bryobacteraceae bacterium]
MKHLRAVNKKARRIEEMAAAAGPPEDQDVIALQNPQNPAAAPPRPHVPMGCSLAFSPGWEVDSSGGTAGLCQPVERDIYDCYVTCFWPAQVPDHLNNSPDWANKCASATKDWRNLDLVFP